MRLLPRFTIVEWLVVLAVCGLLSTIAYDEIQARLGACDGRNDADADIAANTLGLKFAGKPPYCRKQMVAIFQEQYGISLEYIGGCCPSSYGMAYNSAYNDRMEATIRLRDPDFDPDTVFTSVRDLAEARHKAERNARH